MYAIVNLGIKKALIAKKLSGEIEANSIYLYYSGKSASNRYSFCNQEIPDEAG